MTPAEKISAVGLVALRDDDNRVFEKPLQRLQARQIIDSVPWRTVRSRHGQRHHCGRYWSATMNRHVIYESRLELAWLMLADFDPRVRAICAQPFLIRARVNTRVRRHVPDFLLVYNTHDNRLAVAFAGPRPIDLPVRAYQPLRHSPTCSAISVNCCPASSQVVGPLDLASWPRTPADRDLARVVDLSNR